VIFASLLPGQAVAAGAESPPSLVFCCEADNDLYRVARANGLTAVRSDSATAAIGVARAGWGVLILADGYPEKTTLIDQAVLDRAAKKKLRLYVEYPASLPGMAVGKPRATKLQCVVVASEVFGRELEPMRIMMIHACHLVDVQAADPYLVAATVAGVDRAVFGLKDTETQAVLFAHPRGDLLVSTTKLSHFVTARYMPQDAWVAVWKMVLDWLRPGRPPVELKWTPTVRPAYSATEALPPDVELQAFNRVADWFLHGRILRHADWPKEALDWALIYNTVRDMPAADWPSGDGSLGIVEGYSSTIKLDGSQPMRYAVRNDCMGEVAMALAFDAAINSDTRSAKIAGNLLDYTNVKCLLARGPRADPASPSYGLVGWCLDHPDNYYGDDNARALLGALAVSALRDEPRWDEAVARCLLGNLRTTGIHGYRKACIHDKTLQAKGWQSYWNGDYVKYSLNYEGWLWACFLWAYDKTGYEPFLEKSKTAIRMLMEAYPDRWDWCLRSAQIERSRALLPLAWLIRVEDMPEHRRWLRTVADDLLAVQAPCGAIRETLGGTVPGLSSNAEYGKREASLIQQNGDAVADMLYTCNFALIGLHEAAAATGDPFYAEAEEKLVKFLCRIQIRSEAHPELDGAWYRGFQFARWEYWASNADWEWGPWCTESGWGQPWIAGTLALRRMNTSLWELTAGSKIATAVKKYQPRMLPGK
jgi:hypothetical protein